MIDLMAQPQAIYMSILRVEEVPLYHVCPSSLALRIVLPKGPVRCKYCWWDRYINEDSVVTREINTSLILSKINMLKANIVIFDGGEPLLNEWLLDFVKELRGESNTSKHNYFTVIKTLGLIDEEVLAEAINTFDAVLLEYLVPLKPDILVNKNILANLDMLEGKASSMPIEIHILYNGSKRADAIVGELFDRLGARVALHVVPLSEETYESAYRLLERFNKRKGFTYLYRDESFIYTDTTCLSCGAVMIKRKPWGISVEADATEDYSAVCRKCRKIYGNIKICKRPAKYRYSLHRELVIW